MRRSFRCWSVLTLLCLILIGPLAPRMAAAQLDPELRDAVIPAAVQVALPVIVEDDGDKYRLPFSLGSGTIVSADGLVLTNQHVVDPDEQDLLVSEFEARIQQEYPDVSLRIEPGAFTLLSTDGSRAPEPLYEATVVAADEELDLAVLRIVRFDNGDPITAPLTFIPLGDSDAVQLGDPLRVFSYPAIGEDSLTYTTGVVSGFIFDDDTGDRRWITTDTVISGGSSGGTAVNAAGELIGIPTAGTELDCRPGDTNRDGVTDDDDVGCIPTGGSLGRLVPVNVAADFVAEAARAGSTLTEVEPTPGTTVSVADAMATAAASARQSQPEPTPTPANDDSIIFADIFTDEPDSIEVSDADRTISYVDGQLLMQINQPGGLFTYTYPEYSSGGDPVSLVIDVGSTSGWGEVLLLVRTGAGEEWYFAIDPNTQQWSLYRGGIDDGALFYWVEPRSYASEIAGPASSLEITVVENRARLLINGVDVVTESGIEMPELSGDLVFGFGAGINPNSLSGFGDTFAVGFTQIVLTRLDR